MSQEFRRQEPLPATAIRAAQPEIALPDEDCEALRQAVLALEGPSYVARLSALAGRPIELLGQALPPGGVRHHHESHAGGADPRAALRPEDDPEGGQGS